VRNPDARQDYVWYVSYGSNLSRKRFLYYIVGGQPEGSKRLYLGCEDKTDPIEDSPHELLGRLYFARESGVWGGGVAFYDSQASGKVLARRYLVTFDQFLDIVRQENNLTKRPDVSLSAIRGCQSMTVYKSGLYPLLLNLGDLDGCPLLTFTKAKRNKTSSPASTYLECINTGLTETYGMSEEVAGRYLQQFI